MAKSKKLSKAERAELEKLRAEKAAREAEERERAELEALRAEKEAREASIVRSQDTVAESKTSQSIMEPGDDLSMPLGQKIVIAAVAVAVIIIILIIRFGPS